MHINLNKISILTILVLLLLSSYSSAQSFFDESFGDNGIKITQLKAVNNGFWSASIQRDNKIILTGWAYTDDESPSDIALVRLFENGETDTSFNAGGLFSVGNSTWEDAYSSAIQDDGKILIAGRYFNGRSWDFIVIRFNKDGSLDSSFNGKGYFTKDFFGKDDRCFSIDIQSDGKIVACGFTENFNWDFAVLRLNSDGTIDSTFGEKGIKVINIGSYNDVAFSIKAQSDGKIIVCGWTYIFSSWDYALIRLNADGSLDNSFNTTGIVTTDYHHLYNTAHSITTQSDGKYVAAGYTFKPGFPDSDIMLVRYNTDGSIDRTFGNNGIVLIDYESADDFGWVIKTDSYDKLLVGGIATVNSNKSLSLIRLNSNGIPDISFGEQGIIVYKIFGHDEEVRDLVIQPDGKILLTGYFSDRKAKKGFVIRIKNPYHSLKDKKDITLNNFPNPFNRSTKISYIIPPDLVTTNNFYLPVTIKVFDILGREIETIVNDLKEPGYYEALFPTEKTSNQLSSGIYFYRIDVNGISKTQKMVLTK